MLINETKPFTLKLVVAPKTPGVVKIRIWEKGKKHTVYSDRAVGSKSSPIKGQEAVFFNFPVLPKTLKIEVSGAKIVSKETMPLQVAKPSDEKLAEYLTFAKEFCYNMADLKLTANGKNAYASDKGYFTIRYLDQVREWGTGKVLETAARGSLAIHLIEVSRKDFLPLTVVNRLSILLHEYAHSAHKIESEVQCDLFAAQQMLEMGYDKTETLYSLSKLFLFNTHLPESLRKEQESRVEAIFKYISSYNKN